MSGVLFFPVITGMIDSKSEGTYTIFNTNTMYLHTTYHAYIKKLKIQTLVETGCRNNNEPVLNIRIHRPEFLNDRVYIRYSVLW